MKTWFLKAITHDAGLDSIPNTETEQELDLALNSLGSVAGGAIFQGQQNCVNTIKKSMKYIDPNIEGNSIDVDMNLRLLRLSTEFSSDDMQELVAKILAGEYNQPGKFSLKTLDVVKNLRKVDIELFKKFCGFVFDGKYYLINPYTGQSKYSKFLFSEGIGYEKLNYLQDLGLVGNNDSELTVGIEDNNEAENLYTISIQNKRLNYKIKGQKKIKNISSLTIAGIELLPIVGFTENETLVQIVKDYFTEILK